MLDKGQWPSFFDYNFNAEGETLFTPKAGFRYTEKTPYALVGRSNTFAIATGLTFKAIAWDTILFDNYGGIKPNTYDYKIPMDGLYSVNSFVLFEASVWVASETIWYNLANMTSGVGFILDRFTVVSTANAHWWCRGAIVVPCKKNDILQAQLMHSNAGSKSLYGSRDYSYLSIVKVGNL